MFSFEYCEISKCSFSYRTPPVDYTFSKFYVIIEFLDVFGDKIDIFHISCAIALFSFISLVLKLEIYCYFVYIFFFMPKVLLCVTY